jgi:hypothetical protein
MLKERVIKMLEDNEDILDMSQWLCQPSKHYCTYDLAGLILKAAGYVLQFDRNTDQARLPMNAPEVYRQWIDYERQLKITSNDFIDIPALARQVWAEEYGDKAGYALAFYDSYKGVKTVGWWDDIMAVRAYHVIDYLRGEYVVHLNGPLET